MRNTARSHVWRKSSHSGPGDGDSCVLIAVTPTRTAVRDSKDPHGVTINFPTPAFARFLANLKAS